MENVAGEAGARLRKHMVAEQIGGCKGGAPGVERLEHGPGARIVADGNDNENEPRGRRIAQELRDPAAVEPAVAQPLRKVFEALEKQPVRFRRPGKIVRAPELHEKIPIKTVVRFVEPQAADLQQRSRVLLADKAAAKRARAFGVRGGLRAGARQRLEPGDRGKRQQAQRRQTLLPVDNPEFAVVRGLDDQRAEKALLLPRVGAQIADIVPQVFPLIPGP